MTTAKLALTLNLVEEICVSDKYPISDLQEFEFIFALDFEATCWYMNNTKPSEIIEFSAVFYNLHAKTVIDEFQVYVKPTENPQLSDFCTELTKITQLQVDDGVTLKSCLDEFIKWHRNCLLQNNVYCFCPFVTWSDWDLGTCLRKECHRKSISKPPIFNVWIDLRNIYVTYFKRRPRGLKGALSEVGMSFIGQEHCGLNDAKNTAYLASKLIQDGAILKLTSKNSF